LLVNKHVVSLIYQNRETMQQITNIDYIIKRGNCHVWWGDDDNIFGELDICLYELDSWLSSHNENVLVEGWRDADDPIEIVLECEELFKWVGYGRSIELLESYLKENKIIA
jgi:hypothetical protein